MEAPRQKVTPMAGNLHVCRYLLGFELLVLNLVVRSVRIRSPYQVQCGPGASTSPRARPRGLVQRMVTNPKQGYSLSQLYQT